MITIPFSSPKTYLTKLGEKKKKKKGKKENQLVYITNFLIILII